MFNKEIKPFSKRVYLSSPTMHGEEIKYIQEAYETNWMSTAGENIDKVEKEFNWLNYKTLFVYLLEHKKEID